VTLGGDLALMGDRGFGDLGGEKAIMEMGRGLGLLHGVRAVLARGVTEAAPLKCAKVGVLLFALVYSLGMSSDMRRSNCLSSDTASRPAVAERCWGVEGGAADLFAPSIFSNRARRSDTGFCVVVSTTSTAWHSTYNG
jgi:hypothetical protein